MINISKQSSRFICEIFSRQYRPVFQNKLPRRNASFNVRKIDKESYLNKRAVKGVPDAFGIFSLIVPGACFVLAVWQINRKQWKDTLVNDMKTRMILPAVDIPQDLTDRMKMEYRRVKARGTFDHSREMLIGPRSLIVENKFEKNLPFLFPSMTDKPKTNIGYIVVTPFKLSDRDAEILVNRGWISKEQRDPSSRLEGQIEDEIEIEGIIRLKEDKPRYVSQGKEGYRIFKYRNLPDMAAEVNTTPFYIDILEEYTVPGGPAGGQTQVNLKNDHMEYFLTWLTLGLYTTYMWYKRWILKRS